MTKKGTEYPEGPARDVCERTQDPVSTIARTSGRTWIRAFFNFTDKFSSANTTAQKVQMARHEPTHSMKMCMTLKSRYV
jgi:hypothetical protein